MKLYRMKFKCPGCGVVEEIISNKEITILCQGCAEYSMDIGGKESEEVFIMETVDDGGMRAAYRPKLIKLDGKYVLEGEECIWDEADRNWRL